MRSQRLDRIRRRLERQLKSQVPLVAGQPVLRVIAMEEFQRLSGQPVSAGHLSSLRTSILESTRARKTGHVADPVEVTAFRFVAKGRP